MPIEKAQEQAKEIIETARQNAQQMVETAEQTAKLLVEKARIETSQMIVDSIKTAFGQGEEEQKIVRLNRIPYICEDIKEIKGDQKKIMFAVLGTIGSYIIAKILHFL